MMSLSVVGALAVAALAFTLTTRTAISEARPAAAIDTRALTLQASPALGESHDAH